MIGILHDCCTETYPCMLYRCSLFKLHSTSEALRKRTTEKIFLGMRKGQRLQMVLKIDGWRRIFQLHDTTVCFRIYDSEK